MSKKKIITVSIITCNRLKSLKKMLEHFFKNTTVLYELFIIDNGSTDGTRNFLKKEIEGRPNVTIIYNKKNYGPAYAVNQGWYRANVKEYLTRIDDDVLLPPNWAEEMIEICDKIPQVGSVGINFESVSYPEIKVNGCRVQRKEGILGGWFVMVPRRVFEKIGYWNEHLVRIGHEDTEFGWRVLYAGFWNVYHPDMHTRAKIYDTAESQEYVAAKEFAKRTNYRIVKKFVDYYKEIRNLYQRPVPIYLDHIEKGSVREG